MILSMKKSQRSKIKEVQVTAKLVKSEKYEEVVRATTAAATWILILAISFHLGDEDDLHATMAFQVERPAPASANDDHNLDSASQRSRRTPYHRHGRLLCRSTAVAVAIANVVEEAIGLITRTIGQETCMKR